MSWRSITEQGLDPAALGRPITAPLGSGGADGVAGAPVGAALLDPGSPPLGHGLSWVKRGLAWRGFGACTRCSGLRPRKGASAFSRMPGAEPALQQPLPPGPPLSEPAGSGAGRPLAPEHADALQSRPRLLVRGWLAELRPYRWPLVAGLICLLLDLLTKDLASMVLPGRTPLELAPGIRLVHRSNPGLLMGLLADVDPAWRQPLVVTASVFALLCVPALVGWLVRSPRLRAWAVALISAGAMGNLLERLWRGAVVDFLQVGPVSWPMPAFNIADVAILAGAALVVYGLLVFRHQGSPEPAAGIDPWRES